MLSSMSNHPPESGLYERLSPSFSIIRLDYNYTSVKIIKNEVGCRDDTVPKTVETRRHCEED